ncbi:N-acetylmannosamine-6-phosphate 2-epimerase [Leptolyngbya ohadii]|uniref:N-acetylmannosamine-6-phosphate 2-epimerase n=1 Tax=Leptolyngbya ohadii TaxID=1962290 RepID=UPI000B599224|nr:N-acetylmannosamine-6-phosphate 2-epimerase [Leptolyngbya ohadii]
MSAAAAVQSLAGGLIVSCQAPVDSPLHDPMVIAAMAQAAVHRGAIGVRIDTPAHIEAVRQRVRVPIIGLWKRQIPGYEVYITPQFEDAKAVAVAGAEIIAIDATLRDHPQGTTVAQLIDRIHNELGKAVMADVDTLEAALQAAEAGADLVGTTLYGYTSTTQHCQPPGFDLLSQMVDRLSIPVICEGGIASPQMAQAALQRGAFAIVVGTAITGVDALVQSYQSAIHDSVIDRSGTDSSA